MKRMFRALLELRSLPKDLYRNHKNHGTRWTLRSIDSRPEQRARFYCSAVGSAEKEVCNVGTIGHVDHGKTTLSAAITKYISEKNKSCKYVPYNEIDKAPEEKARGITINIAHLGYSTEKRRYAHTDCPGHADFVKNMISGASQMDGAILLIAADDGNMPQTKEHLLLTRQIGLKHVVVYVNKADLVDNEILELVEIEARELLSHYGFDGLGAPVVIGSALLALNGDASPFGTPSIQALLDALDSYIPVPKRDYVSPLVLPVDSVFNVKGRGTVAVGTISRGTLKKGDSVDLLGFDTKTTTIVSDIEIFQKPVPVAKAGDNVGVLLRNVKVANARRGMYICGVNSQLQTNHFEAQIYLLDVDEGGRTRPLPEFGFCTMIYSSTWNIYCRFDLLLPSGSNILMPGEHAVSRLTLLSCMPMLEGQVFTIRENKITIGTGRVTKRLSRIEVDRKRMGKLVIPELHGTVNKKGQKSG